MRLLSSDEAQEKLGISRPTLYLWVRQGKLKPQRAGRGLRFEEDEVMRLLGRGPHVAVWIRGGRIEEARREVGRWVRANARTSCGRAWCRTGMARRSVFPRPGERCSTDFSSRCGGASTRSSATRSPCGG